MGLDCLKGLEGDRAQGYHYLRVDDLKRVPQKVRTVSQFGPTGLAVSPRFTAGIAERGAGDEDILTAQTNRREKAIEVLARLIAGEWDAGLVSAFATWGFADKHYPCRQRAVQFTQNSRPLTHRGAARALGSFGDDLLEQLLL